MQKLAFVIPTWNRPKQLEVCLESICSQIGTDLPVSVTVLDDCSDVATVETVQRLNAEKEYAIIYKRREERTDYADTFRDMFRAAPQAEWVWTFGDDDILRDGGLKFVLDRLETENVDFIHVAERKRASGTNNIYYAHRLLDLCNTFGWIDMTGFITGNITRQEYLLKAADSPRWPIYAKSAFVQSGALLDVLHDRPAVFYDKFLIDSQDVEMTQETGERWATQNIAARYVYAVDAIESMVAAEILPAKLPTKFFRYLNAHLWDRFLFYIINDHLTIGAQWPDELLERVGRFATLLADEAEAKALQADLRAAKGMINLAQYMTMNLNGINGELGEIQKRHAESPYPFHFAEPVATA